MLMEKYSYEMDIEVQREEAAAEATEKVNEKINKNLVKHVEAIAEGFHISAEEACSKLKESYQEYLEIKKSLPPDIHK